MLAGLGPLTPCQVWRQGPSGWPSSDHTSQDVLSLRVSQEQKLTFGGFINGPRLLARASLPAGDCSTFDPQPQFNGLGKPKPAWELLQPPWASFGARWLKVSRLWNRIGSRGNAHAGGLGFMTGGTFERWGKENTVMILGR